MARIRHAEYRRVKEGVKAMAAAWYSLNQSIFAMLRRIH